jgi:hypothetical protein
MRTTGVLQIAILLMVAPALAACGDTEPVANIRLEIYREGSREAGSGGLGTLSFQGRSHLLSISGVSLPATAAVPKVELVGKVQQLSRLEDFAGAYRATEAGAVLGGGSEAARLENPHGVRLELLARKLAPDLTLDLDGMQISLAE